MKHGALVQKSGMMRKNPFLKRMRLQMTKSRSISVKSRSGFPTGREKNKKTKPKSVIEGETLADTGALRILSRNQ
jgi:hypothetical protein